MLLILCMLQVTLKQCITQFPFITHGWVSQNQFFSLIYRDFSQMEMHLQKAPKKITLKLLKTQGRFFQILLCDLSFGGKDGTPSLSTTQRKKCPPIHLLVLCSQFFLTKHQKKKKIHCSPAQTVIKLQQFRKSWESQISYVNWNKAGDSGNSQKQQVKMSE